MSFRKFSTDEDTQLVTLVSSEGVESPVMTKEEMRVILEGLSVLPGLLKELRKMNIHLAMSSDLVIDDADLPGG